MESDLPRTTVWLARAQLGAVALVVLAALVGGLGMQLELWEPGALWSKERYSDLLGLHGLTAVAIGAPALAGCFGYIAIAKLLGVHRVAAPAIAWIAFGLWVIGLGVTAFTIVRPADTGWSMYTPYSLQSGSSNFLRGFGPLAIAVAGLIYTGHLAAIIAGSIRRDAPERLTIAVAFVLAIAAACIFALLDTIALISSDPFMAPRLGPYALSATLAAALTLATATLVGKRGLVLALLAIAGGTLWAFVPLFVLGVGVVGVWVALAVINGFGRTTVAFVVPGCGPLIVMLGLARVLTVGSDVHLHDTHFVVGMTHLTGAIIAFTMLAALHAHAVAILGRAAHPTLAWIGGIAVSTGTLLHAFASIEIGTSGMPRRYWDYDPEFTYGHMLGGRAVAIMLAGLLLLAIAWLVGDRRRHGTV